MSEKLTGVTGPASEHLADGGKITGGYTNQKALEWDENFTVKDGQDIELTGGGDEKAQLSLDTQKALRKLTMNEDFTIGDGEAGTITFSASGKTLTVANDASVSGTNTGDQNVFQTIAVSGQDNVVADSTTDTLTLAAGTGITITTNANSDTVTIAASGTMADSELTADLDPLVINTNYTANKAGTMCACVLPATAPVGSIIKMNAKGATLFSVAAAAGDTIICGGISTKAGGKITAKNTSTSVTLECITADTTWLATCGAGYVGVEDA